MRILIVVDSLVWAIGHLAKAKIKYNPHHEFKLVEVHPRDAGEQSVQESFKSEVESFNPDLIHFEYFRSASQLLEAMPELQKRKILLTHHNQRDKALKQVDWFKIGIDHIAVHTERNKEKLAELFYEDVTVINHGIDLEFFKFSDKEPNDFIVGYAGRIVPWKRLKDISSVSKELDLNVRFMGKQDKVDYWNTFTQEEQDNIVFDFMDCKDEDRLKYYRNISCYVGFSDDHYEEGTLELLEAMACGVPVITTPSGVARDICKDDENALMVEFGDTVDLKKAIKRLQDEPELRAKLRKNGWNTVKNMTEEKMAYEYSLLYNKVINKEKLVSVIIPTTFDRMDQLIEILGRIEKQSYPNIEVIIGFDETSLDLEQTTKDLRRNFNLTIKTVMTNQDGYNLAMSRNLCVVEAEGEYLVFLDSRIKPSETAVLEFIQILQDSEGKQWVFGNKGGNKPGFVENFSAVKRLDFVKFGMMNERINQYGGMSQEIRNRWKSQGGQFIYLKDTMAQPIKKTSMNPERRKSIIDMKFKLYKLYRGLRG